MFGITAYLLTGLRKTVNIGRQQVCFRFTEKFPVRRHTAVAALLDRLHDGRLRPAVEPDVVAQIRRAECGVAFAFRTMAGDTELLEFLFTGDRGVFVDDA